jgi:type II secretory pathway predicted ATPase ExeA
MIQEYFQLQRRPFVSTPAPEHYFPASSVEAARIALLRLVERNEGPGLVIGPVGTGKSILCQLLAATFRHRFRVVVSPLGRLPDRRALLQSIIFELGLPYRDLDEVELRLSLIDHVTNRELCPRGLLLLIDEAESLSLSLLNELRSLASLTWQGGGCVRMVLFGSPRLEEKFTHPRLESFNQRIAGRHYLEPFTSNETCRFIERSFAGCGGDPYDVFTPEALQKIHNACGGIPRLVNQLTDHTLVLAAIGNHGLVDSDCVEEAWADLQQLPVPHRGQLHQGHLENPPNIVEFGDLGDPPGDDATRQESKFEQYEPTRKPAQPSARVDDGVPSNAVQQMSECEPEADCRTPTEFTLVFHSADNPFGDDFEEEERVIDQFVSPDALAQRHRRQVATTESERLAEQMFQLRRRASTDARRNEEAANDVPASSDTLTHESTAATTSFPTTDHTAHPTHSTPTKSTALFDHLATPHAVDAVERCEIIYLADHAGVANDDYLTPLADETAVSPVNPAVPSADAAHGHSPRNYHNLFSQLRRRG